jgi:hypothetical protein
VLVNLAGGRNKKSVPRGATCAQLLRPLRRADGPHCSPNFTTRFRGRRAEYDGQTEAIEWPHKPGTE